MHTLDRELLTSLQENCKLSYAELSGRLGAPISTVSDRLKRLQSLGIFQGQVALVHPRALGLDVCAFVQVLTDRPENERVFLDRVRAMPEVQECHHITGEFSYLLKVRSRTTAHLEALLDQIKPLPGVQRTSTVIVLSSPKETTVLPLYDVP